MEEIILKKIYKKFDGIELNLHIFNPSKFENKMPSLAVVFFFGGGFAGGSPEQFYPHCRHLTEKDVVGISAEYRIFNLHKTKPIHSLLDGKSAIRWVRQNAKNLNIDPLKIIGAGGSSGGMVALCSGVIDDFEPPNEDYSISSKSNGLILFNPVVDGTFIKSFGENMEKLSPIHNVKKGNPPTIIFHGTSDTVVPFDSVQKFSVLMKERGNYCKLYPFQGKGHAFFNYGMDNNVPYYKTLDFMDQFLTKFN